MVFEMTGSKVKLLSVDSKDHKGVCVAQNFYG